MRIDGPMKTGSLTHVDEKGQASMVDVSAKPPIERLAVAQAVVQLPDVVASVFSDGDLVTKKGSVVQTAILAGTMGAKKTAELIPLCHIIPLESVKFDVRFVAESNELRIVCEVKATYKTGVEMEALSGASIAALTAYDMVKALSSEVLVKEVRLLAKHKS